MLFCAFPSPSTLEKISLQLKTRDMCDFVPCEALPEESAPAQVLLSCSSGAVPKQGPWIAKGSLLSVLAAFTFHVVCLEVEAFVFEQLNFSVRCALLASESPGYKCFAAAL